MDLSIIVPVYNAEKYLPECLDSMEKLEEKNIEFLLVNDGSTDSSESICREFEKRDDRFVVISKENGGVSDARNVGMSVAKGNYIMFLDADDILNTDQFHKVVPYLKSDRYDMVAFEYYTYISEDKIIKETYGSDQRGNDDPERINELMYASSKFNQCWGKLLKKSVIDKYGISFPKELKIGEDYMFMANFVRCADCMCTDETGLVFYRQHSGSAMRKYNMEERTAYLNILYKYNKECVTELGNENLTQKMNAYYFRVVTSLFREFSYLPKDDVKKAYRKALDDETISGIIEKTNESQFSFYKKYEYRLFKNRKVNSLVRYFKLKAKLTGIR